MATSGTLLCIHRDPAQLGLLQENGYKLLTATNGHDGLRLFMSQTVDAVVLEYHLGLLNGLFIAGEIKQIRPQVPIVMLADHLDLPEGASESVDALLAKSDGAHFLLATVHFVLSAQSTAHHDAERIARTPTLRGRPAGARRRADRSSANSAKSATDGKDAPLSPRIWRGIRNGTVQF